MYRLLGISPRSASIFDIILRGRQIPIPTDLDTFMIIISRNFLKPAARSKFSMTLNTTDVENVIFNLLREHPSSFSRIGTEIKDKLGVKRVSSSYLSKVLKRLESHEVVRNVDDKIRPPAVIYSLTDSRKNKMDTEL